MFHVQGLSKRMRVCFLHMFCVFFALHGLRKYSNAIEKRERENASERARGSNRLARLERALSHWTTNLAARGADRD